MSDYKTPGVYIEEISTLPASIAAVETAIPAFIGYTEKAEKDDNTTALVNVPTRITSLLDENDCAIIISYSGNNKESVPMCFIELLKAKNVSMIGITSKGENYIREEIDCVLTISSWERLYSKIAGFTTEESIMHILNILYSCYFAKNYQEYINYKVNNSRMFEKARITSIKNLKEDKYE